MRPAVLWTAAGALAAAVLPGCGCGEKGEGPCPERGVECCIDDNDCYDPALEYMECCLVTHECIELPDETDELDDGCDPGYACDSLNDIQLIQGETAEEGCHADWSCCSPRDPLPMGKIGTHSSMGIAGDGTVWLSGYAAGVTETQTYGDLAAGTWDEVAGEVGWELLDGVPLDAEPYAPPDGWRGGINEPGDDVGLYTGLVLDAAGEPRIAYHDATNGDLRYIASEGGTWNDPVVVDSDGVAGTYAAMALVGGAPAIAYRADTVRMADVAGASHQVGTVVSSLRWAVAGDASASTWTVEEVTSADTPCFGTICPAEYRCRVADGLCWREDLESAECQDPTGAFECTSDEACLQEIDDAGTPLSTWGCEEAVPVEPVFDLPEGIALWNALALSPDGNPEVVYYDRTLGDLVWVASDGSSWSAPVTLDGSDVDPDPARHGDKGWNPSLAIDSTGVRHVAYVDGLAETLDYLSVDPSGAVLVREVVDDGSTSGSERDLVGDYSAIVVDGSGRVRLAYQNTSSGVVVMAVRDPLAGSWTRSVLTDPAAGFMGYYLNQLLVGDTSWFSQFAYNYEMDPFYRGLRVFSCSVGSDGTATCG